MHRTAAAVCLVTFAALGGCQSTPKPLTDADRAAARSMDSAYSAAVAAGDEAGMMAIYAPDAIMQAPGMPAVKGADQIRTAMHSMGGQKYTIQLTQETADGMGDVMYTTGKYHYQSAPADTGAAMTEDGKYLEVFRRGADGTWKLVAESWNADAMPAPPAAPAAKPASRRGK